MKRMVKRLLCAATTLFAVSYLFSFCPMKAHATEVPIGEDVYTVTDTRFGAKGDDTEADAVAIQKALDLARETEATITVYIPDGTYYLDRFLIIYSDTKLVLADHAIIRRSPDYSAIMLINGADDTDVVGTSTTGGYGQCNNISVEGGTWDGTITGAVTSYDNLLYFGHADGVTVKNTNIKNVYGVHLLELTGVKNATVSKVAFSGFHASDNAEEDAFKEAIQLDSTTEIGSELYVPYDATPCKDVTVDNCTFDGTPCGIGSHSYVDNVYHSGVTITNNKFKNISNRLVTLTNYSNFRVANNLITSDTTVNNVVSIDVVNSAGSIESNNIGKATENGIYIMGGSDVSVIGNTIKNTVLSAVRVTGSIAYISENIISGTTKDAGIKAAEDSRVQIVQNTISDCAITLIATEDVDGAVIKQNLLKDATSSNGITVATSDSGTEILNNTITNVGEYPIFIHGSKGTTVSGNIIDKFSTSGVYVTTGYTSGVASSDVQIKDNIISNGQSGIEFSGTKNLVITDNEFSTISGCPIVVSDTAKGTIINKNIFYGNGNGKAIMVFSGDSSTSISENTIQNFGDIPVILYGGNGVKVKDNNITGFSECGIYVRASSDGNSKATNITISGNTISGGKTGIGLKNTDKVTISKNKLSLSSEWFIYAEASCVQTVISQNNINCDNKGSGIQIFSGDSGTKISENTIENAKSYPILLYGGNGVQVLDNTLIGFTEYGIYLRTALDNVTRPNSVVINGNKIKGGKVGIYVKTADKTVISNNNTCDSSICAIFVEKDCKNSEVKNNISSDEFRIWDSTAIQSGNGSGKNGLAQDENGVWYYYTNGSIDTSVTTLVNYEGAWYYVQKGKLNWSYTGLVLYKEVWYYVEKGKVNFGATTLCNYGGSWWYVKKGAVDFGATTLCNYGGKWWYVEKGKVNFGATTLCNYNGSWWYVKKGAVDFGATTLCNYGGKWWYVEKGKVNFGATTLCNYNGSWWYVRNGAVDFSSTTLCLYGGKWWYVTGGKVNFSATTLCKYGSKWYYVNKGVVDFSYSGPVVYNGKTYTVKNGVMV